MTMALQCVPKRGLVFVYGTLTFEQMERYMNTDNQNRINAGLQCYFGKLSDKRCGKAAQWVSTFKGNRTEMVWCDEHKPDPTQILSNNFHNLESI